jgi:selenide,water dikinase
MLNLTPIVKNLVFVGGGHAHALVIRMWAMNPLPGVRLTLVSPNWKTPYSGMLPGLLAGHYSSDDIHIDLRKLCTWANVRFIEDRVISLDRQKKLIQLEKHPNISYDALSIDIGSTPDLRVEGLKEFAHPVKPIDQFYPSYVACLQRCRDSKPVPESLLKIAVVGGGAGGIEVVLAIAQALSDIKNIEITLVNRREEILSGYPLKIAKQVIKSLEAVNVQLKMSFDVIRVEKNRLISTNNQSIEADEIFFCTQAIAAEWPSLSGLESDSLGFISVNQNLQAMNDHDIFASGDIANMHMSPRPKAGVYAVRQAPILLENLKRYLLNEPLTPYVPQDGFLSLLSLGQKKALAARNSLTLTSQLLQPFIWRVKNSIDQKFMAQFSNLPALAMLSTTKVDSRLIDNFEKDDIKNHAIRCAGCGSKVGSSILRQVITNILGGQQFKPEDAVTINTPDTVLLQTVDQITSPIDSPYLFGKIATIHALSDIYAMNAAPKSVQILLNLPFASAKVQTQEMTLVMQGVHEVLSEHNCDLIGGHTAEAKELSLGLVVNALTRKDKALFQNDHLKAGDTLVITKPIGTGVILAAQMHNKNTVNWVYRGDWHNAALESMLVSNKHAAEFFSELNVIACTDITGFGLIGHLCEMLEASHCIAEITLDNIPLLLGAKELSHQNIRSSLYPQNFEALKTLSITNKINEHPAFPLLFDPQTSGGLLAGLSPQALDKLEQQTDLDFYVIGKVTEDRTGWDLNII